MGLTVLLKEKQLEPVKQELETPSPSLLEIIKAINEQQATIQFQPLSFPKGIL
jgi:hypothetical protein